MNTLRLMPCQNSMPIIRKQITHLTKLLCLLLYMSVVNYVSGQKTVVVFMKASNGSNETDRTFVLRADKKVYENNREIASNVEKMEKDFGYIDPTTSTGKEKEVLYIKKTGENKPRVFLNENFETNYLKQDFACPDARGVQLKLYGDQVFKGEEQILENCQILRCENGYTLAHRHDGLIKLYTGGKNWADIKQIITVDNASYYVKKDDNTIWQLKEDPSKPTKIGSNASLLQDNDNQLINLDPQGKYFRWDGTSWTPLQPKYISVSPAMADEGFWFFIQAKPLLNSVTIQDQKKGLTYNNEGMLEMRLIPETGDCDQFLWRTQKLANGKSLLINKTKGESTPLLLGADGKPTFKDGGKEWNFNVADRAKFGTNGYQVIGANNKALSFTNSAIQSKASSSIDLEQVWLLQFNQMVKDYFLPMPTKENLDANFLPAESADITELNWNGVTNIPQKLSTDEIKQLRTKLKNSYSEISKSYNKFLKGSNGVSFFATNTSTDWVIVNYYFVINNMMNAVTNPKPSYAGVEVKDLSVMNGRNLVIINKNDLSSEIPKQFFSLGFQPDYLAKYRGGSGYRDPFTDAITTSEELTCKTGIVNRPLDNNFRRFDHGIHEFGHALQELCNWVGIVKADIAKKQDIESRKPDNDASKKTPKQINDEVCYDCNENSRSPECICFMLQNWFNSSFTSEYYPTKRADNDARTKIMEIIFKKENTWMPPKDLRKNGYLPSGTKVNQFTKGKSFLAKGERLSGTKTLTSNNNQYQCRVTPEGRVVIEKITIGNNSGQQIISTQTETWSADLSTWGNGGPDSYLVLQENDGHLCFYTAQAGYRWCGPGSIGGEKAVLEDNGCLVVYNAKGAVNWRSCK